jgi:hypothetical protein
VWRRAAPTSDKGPGQAGKVHSGFLRCWYETGMDKRVLGMAKILIEGAFDLSKLKIYLTGGRCGPPQQRVEQKANTCSAPRQE